jgi:hypothetical protein
MYGSVLPTSVEHTAQATGHSEEEEVRAQSVASYRQHDLGPSVHGP